MEQLAVALGVSEGYISLLESGKRRISYQTFKKLERLQKTIRGQPQDKIDRLFEVIKFIFATPDNIEKMNEIYRGKQENSNP